jgi:hypothetical protein
MTRVSSWHVGILSSALALALGGCGGGDTPPAASSPPVESVQEHGGVRLVRLPPAGPDYGQVRLSLQSPEPGARFSAGETVSLQFSLEGLDLNSPTPDAESRGLARAPGQHVHLVVNDAPYRALYDVAAPVLVEGLPEGTHVLRAFPGRDWHEGIKNPGALVQQLVVVGEGEPTLASPETWGPTLIYSRPQGTYEGAGVDSVMVDFFLSGVELSEAGNRVRLTVDGGPPFFIHEWHPHVLLGLAPGEHVLRMDLVDGSGAPIAAPFTPVERTITLVP